MCVFFLLQRGRLLLRFLGGSSSATLHVLRCVRPFCIDSRGVLWLRVSCCPRSCESHFRSSAFLSAEKFTSHAGVSPKIRSSASNHHGDVLSAVDSISGRGCKRDYHFYLCKKKKKLLAHKLNHEKVSLIGNNFVCTFLRIYLIYKLYENFFLQSVTTNFLLYYFSIMLKTTCVS